MGLIAPVSLVRCGGIVKYARIEAQALRFTQSGHSAILTEKHENLYIPVGILKF